MKIKGLLALSAFSFILLGLPAVASAQWGGNGGYGNNGGYYGNGNLRSVVRNLKNKAERFEDSIDRWDDRNDDRNDNRNRRIGGWGNNGGYGNNGGNLENLTDQFTNAVKRLEDRYGNGRNMNNSADEARRVLDLAASIDREIYNARGRNLQGQWNSMRQDLNMIASAYGYNNNNGYPNRNNRRNRGNNFPFPF